MTRRDFIKRFFIATGIAGATACGGGIAYLHTPQFGRKPSKKRLERMLASPNWKDGAFRNYEPLSAARRVLPDVKRSSRAKVMWNFLFGDKKHLMPSKPLEVVKTDFSNISISEDSAVWLGHSSVFLTLGCYRILIDPVFSPYASPAPFINRAFPGSQPCTAADIPHIDLLLVSHDHWDHLDYPTLRAIKDRVVKVATPLGVGEYLEQWGYAGDAIVEGDWWDVAEPLPGLKLTFLPSRHFSGRLRRPNQTLWSGFLIECGGKKVLFSGDGGFGRHVYDIARRAEGCDLAFIENGQYNDKWPACHMAPPESLEYALAVKAKAVVPVHNCKFVLSEHVWDEPLKRFSTLAYGRAPLLTPRIGEAFHIPARDAEGRTRWFEEA